MFKSSNPILSQIDNTDNSTMLQEAPMTVKGTINKTFLLLLIASISASAVVFQAFQGYADKVMSIMTIALITGLIIGIATSFLPKIAKFTSPIYAFAEGAVLAGISLLAESHFPGIALQAVSATIATFFVMLFLYKTGVIKVTEKFRATIMSAIWAVLIIYLIQIIGSFFNFSVPFLNGSGIVSIIASFIISLIAAFSLMLDFDFIEKGAQNLLPKDFEWYASFGLLVTLVWLYVEILNLLAKLRDN